jgi:hypothetical protein
MDNPGPFQLTINGGAFQIGAAGTYVGDIENDLAGMLACAFQAQFAYTSGGTSVAMFVQTSIDQGQTWFDIWAQQWTTAGGIEAANVSALTPRTTPYAPVNQGLTPGTVEDGLLGDRLRAVVVVVGTYVQSALNITGCAR